MKKISDIRKTLAKAPRVPTADLSALFVDYAADAVPLSLLRQSKEERPERIAFWSPDGRRGDFAPALPRGAYAVPLNGVVWPAERVPEVEAASWSDQGVTPKPMLLWLETCWVRACIVECEPTDFVPDHYPLARLRDGELEWHFSEGGFQPAGFLIDSRPQPTEAPVNAEAVRRAIGHCVSGRFADVDEAALLRIEEVEPSGDGFAIAFEAFGAGQVNSFSLIWGPQEGDPRKWFAKSVGRLKLLPGSKEYWP